MGKPLRLFGSRIDESAALVSIPDGCEWSSDQDTMRIDLAKRLVCSLRRLREKCEDSSFFQSREFIGSSLLFIIDAFTLRTGLYLIDLAKTRMVPEGITIDHRRRWEN